MRARRLQWFAAGAALVVIHCLLLALSRAFDPNAPLLTYPVVSVVALEMLAAALYLSLAWLIPRSRAEPGLLVLVLVVGIVIRALGVFSTPVLEDDYYRYLWDGAVVVGGHDPYRYSPAEVLHAGHGANADAELAALAALAADGDGVVARINYPRLSSVYPPLAQAGFALGALVERFSLVAWRLVLLLFEAMTVALLYLILRRLDRSALWLALYLWNPLLVKELVNSAHMDALLLPFLVAVLLLALEAREVLASLLLALAAGIKLWPVLLLPTVLRPLLAEPRRLCAAVAVFAAGFAGTAWWLWGHAGAETGLGAYALGWEMNDGFFLVLHWLVAQGLAILKLEWTSSAAVARALVATGIVWLAFAVNARAARDPEEISERFLMVTAAVFLLAPAEFPWYYTWLVPFLVLVPSPALLSLTALLPLYYLRFYLDFRGQAQYFDYGMVWLEYLPVWILLAWAWWRPAHPGGRVRLAPDHP